VPQIEFSWAISLWWLSNLAHLLLERSSGGSQQHESESEQKHELQAVGQSPEKDFNG
jgi:hypothetical protein